MLKGLRKRETYEELINELEQDPIKKYPDRRASQIENGNYMSQLALGLQEVTEQNNRMMKEKTKELLLQDMAHSSSASHHDLKTSDFGSLGSLGMSGLLGSYQRPSFLPTTDPDPTMAPEGRLIADDDRPMVDWSSYEESNARMRSLLNFSQPLLDQHQEIERQHHEQLAILHHEAEVERQMHHETLQHVMQQTRTMLDQANNAGIDRMLPSFGGASSSSTAAPDRLQIQDIEQTRLAIEDAAAAAAAASTSGESTSDVEAPNIRPGMLQPRTEDVRHLYKPKHERRKKRPSVGEKEYFNTFEEWNREGIKF